ncbi:GAF domain-containing protein [Alkalimonas collagenimarina]|uniref:histidine kinase n=1 Tax=Alkalimonas collagenimarina TaxID=400390 RepID=A0ABT9GZI4_9GAMM|nr:GAF domain-containing protein [Alkalimonas collagenimarina]MDP4536274.1 GAF domain-containing protein [Alkalimonas collagenimarina]
MTAAPLPADEAERLTALYETGLLDSAPEQRFDRITRLAKQLFSTDIALISLIDEHRQWFKSKIGMDECETARELSFCAHAILSDDILLVPDTLLDERFVNHPAVVADNGIRFYAGAPLHHPKGYRLGTLCLAGPKPRSMEQYELKLLRDLADIAEREIADSLLHAQFAEWQQERAQLKQLEQQQLRLSAIQAGVLAAPQLFSTTAGSAWRYLTEQISEALQVQRVSIWLFNADGAALLTEDLFERKSQQHSSGAELRQQCYPRYFAALQSNNVLAIDDAQHNPATAEFNQDYLKPLDIKSMLDAVIVSEQGMVGVICAEQVGTSRHWQSSEQNFMTAMASVASTVHSYLQQHKLHQELSQAQQRLDETCRLARIGFWELNLNSGELEWTPIVFDIFGLDPQQPMSFERYMEMAHPDDHQLLEVSKQQAIEDGHHSLAHRITLPDGAIRWVHLMARYIPATAISAGRLVGSVQDITDIKQAEQERDQLTYLLQNVMDAASEVSIIAVDNDGIIQLFNYGAERMLGYTAGEVIGKATPALFHDQAAVQKRGEELTELLGYPVHGFRVFVELPELHGSESRQWTYYRKDGQALPVQLLVTPRRHQDGSIHGYLGIAYDISERLRLQQMKNEFISTVSHELRTPLTSINGALGLVLSGTLGDLPEQSQTLLKVAQSNTKRLNFLINDLLDIEKLEAGKMQFDIAPHSLLQIVEQAIEENQPYGLKCDIRLLLDNQLQGAVDVIADPQRLLQVLANVLSNAIKFSPDHAAVQVVVLATETVARVEVHDHGPGISDDFKSKIFQKFSQADSTSRRAKSGTGLGLALSKELMEAMSGSIGFDSVFGQGSCFYIEMKVASE